MRVFIFFLFAAAAAAAAVTDLLQNGDFELPPKNAALNETVPALLLTPANPIPGWSFNGTVEYIISTANISLPRGSHALQLGQDGSISQSFKSDGSYAYALTFSLSPGSTNENCSSNVAVNISASDSSALFYLQQQYGKEKWETHAWYWINSQPKGGPVNITIRSQALEIGDNVTCGLAIDTLLLKGAPPPIQEEHSLLVNWDFELGPEFLGNSTEGILLDPSSGSPVQGWSVTGIVKYIDSKHYSVPHGNAAIELSGIQGGMQQTLMLDQHSTYSLQFTMGDANDSCIGNFILGATAGSASHNFTLQSKGTGVAQNFSMTFKPVAEETLITFVSYSLSQNRDLDFCGPVLDMVILQTSNADTSASYAKMLLYCLMTVVIILTHSK
ncbi:hypothetical protein EJ110_NYTH23690 [Nymphaea thermarum]|nr:hypothetical protein EJ110_NYTH23690 [Nymphaea thermarum]